MAAGFWCGVGPALLRGGRGGLLGRAASLCTVQPLTESHRVLGVQPGATPAQISRAYLERALRHNRAARRGRGAAAAAASRDGGDAAAAAAVTARAHLTELARAYDALTGETLPTRTASDGRPLALGSGRSATSAALAAGEGVVAAVHEEQLVRMPAYVPPPLRRFADWMRRLPDLWDELLGHTYDSLIHKLLREDSLAEAFDCFAEMKAEGQKPTAATYEMLIRGCTLAMERVTPDTPADRLTLALYGRVLELWSEMREQRLRVDRFTYIELMRACGKAGQVEAAWVLFTKMLSLPQFLPDERALDSMYELCTSAGAHARALDVFREHSELRKTLFAPRLTPVSFTHLIRAGVEGGQMHRLGPVLDEMERFRVFPAVGTCARLLGAAVAQGELEVAARVVALTRRAGHVPDRLLLDAYDAERAAQRLGRGAGKAAKREGVARGAAAPAAAARALPSPRGGHAP